MKRVLLFTIAIAQAWALSAQVSYDGKKQYETIRYSDFVKGDVPGPSKKGPVGDKVSGNNKSYPETILGITNYDLQTNATVHDRIAVSPTGDISVVWTASETNDIAFPDRGTGYTHYSPSLANWEESPSYPRIESDRCGWPTVLYDGDGGEIVISHSTASLVMKLNKRSTIGTGEWSESNISSTYLTWNRATMGGSDGNSIHMIAATNEADSANFEGMAQAIVYYRSTDKGDNWDKQDLILPGLGSADLGKGNVISADAYSIVADGNHIAIGVFNAFNDVILLESMNNGDTWTSKVVHNFGYKGFTDFDLNHGLDTIVTCDASGSMIIDDNGVVHMTWGRMSITNSTQGDELFNRFYFTDSLVYYRNSNPPLKAFCGYYDDANNNNTVDVSFWADYGFQGAVSFPNMAVGTNGDIYVLYTGLAEDAISSIDGSTTMRHLYLTTSTDGGNSFSTPEDLTTTDIDLSENVYGDIHNVVDSNGVRIVYQRDAYPSVFVPTIAATGSPGTSETWQLSISQNGIVYLGIDTNTTVGIEHVISPVQESNIYPNPSDGLVDMTIRVFKDVAVDLFITNQKGQVVYTYNDQPLVQGRNQIQLDLTALKPGMYFVNLRTEDTGFTEKILIK